ncbi:MAG: undecaprenyl-diphosphate phosphatase [Phycisphaerales bacterium]|nr:undecaprenyl-diphosphate phosphatase [Phycisphaerales bacterium]MCB9862333.1 undecaprenyl-diphosphate phosphatase [Phycisphaerales bacterium]
MSDAIRAVILGIIEGLTEFLPVSSTGHMLLAMPMLDVAPETPPWPIFLFFIQIGAIVSVVIYFWRDLWRQIFSMPLGGWSNHLLTKLVVATIPAAAIGIPFDDFVDKYLHGPAAVAITLIVGAVVMVLIELRYRRMEGPSLKDVTLKQAFLIGVAQCFAIIPGTSRSMATILGGLIVGLPATTAAEFSFLIAIPTICGAGLLKLIKHADQLNNGNIAVLGLGFSVSFVVALLVVAAFMSYIRRRSLIPFAIYRALLGLAVLAVIAFGGFAGPAAAAH